MGERHDLHRCMPADWTHLPPPEQSLLLKRDRKGTIKTVEKIPTPLDEYGIPDANEMLRIAMSTLSADYTPPGISNVHHLVYPRSQYHHHPSGSPIPRLYRESARNMVRYQQQLHNYFHEIFADPLEASMDVMYLCAKEQSEVDMSFFVGQTAIQLSRNKYSEIVDDDILRTHLRFNALRDSRQLKAIFYDLIGSYPDSEVGILPDRQWLVDQPFEKAVKALGTLAGAQSLDARRDAATLVKKIGIL